MTYQIINNDVIKWAAEYDGPKFHAMLTDCPYHLASINKRFGKATSAPAKGGVYNRASKGFMGQDWDKVDEDGLGVAFRPETWAALAQHLYPGAFILAFAGTRGYHRMAVAMEDAGLIIHPAVGFLFLSGFPKATRVKDSLGFAGHRYGLQALKPAFEFIAVAQVPYSGRPVDNITQTGAGALNIDNSRIPVNGEDLSRKNGGTDVLSWGGTYGAGDNEAAQRQKEGLPALGRWPANFLLQCECSSIDWCDCDD